MIVAVGTRLSDFTTGSRNLFPQAALLSINVDPLDAHKHGGTALVADAGLALAALDAGRRAQSRLHELGADPDAPHVGPYGARLPQLKAAWRQEVDEATQGPRAPEPKDALPTDAQVLGVVQRWAQEHTTIVAAAGGSPGELH